MSEYNTSTWNNTVNEKNKLLHMLEAIEDVTTDSAIRAGLSEGKAATLDAALALAYALEDAWADKLRDMEYARVEGGA